MKCAKRIDNRPCFVYGVSRTAIGRQLEPDTFELYFADIMNAFSEFIVKSVRAHQKFAVKNVDPILKFVAFFAIRWYTIFAV